MILYLEDKHFMYIVSQGRRKQIFSGKTNQPQTYVYREFRVMSGHTCKCNLLCEAQSTCVAC